MALVHPPRHVFLALACALALAATLWWAELDCSCPECEDWIYCVTTYEPSTAEAVQLAVAEQLGSAGLQAYRRWRGTEPGSEWVDRRRRAAQLALTAARRLARRLVTGGKWTVHGPRGAYSQTRRYTLLLAELNTAEIARLDARPPQPVRTRERLGAIDLASDPFLPGHALHPGQTQLQAFCALGILPGRWWLGHPLHLEGIWVSGASSRVGLSYSRISLSEHQRSYPGPAWGCFDGRTTASDLVDRLGWPDDWHRDELTHGLLYTRGPYRVHFLFVAPCSTLSRVDFEWVAQ